MERAKKGLAKLYQRIFKSWQSTLIGVSVGAFTLLLALGKIDVNEFLALLGAIGTILGLFSKDNAAIED